MRKRIMGMVCCSALAAVIGSSMVDVNASEIREDIQEDIIQEESMSLIQDGEIIIPENDYSFEEDGLISYLDTEENSDKALQLKAQEARSNDNETLAQREKDCAAALYNAMINFEDKVSVAEFALTKEEFKETISDLVNSNPELFYIGQKYGVQTFNLSESSSEQIVKICMGFYECQSPVKDKKIDDGETKEVTVGYTDVDTGLIAGQKQVLENKKKEILDEILADGMSDACKALLIHDYIILNVKYDYAAYLKNRENGTSTYAESDYDIYGALVKGQAVCQGYTLAYKYLMEAAGVSDVGFACTGGHIWNTVSINGEGYYVDCTWDDPSWDTLGNVKHKYLLKGGSDFTGHGTIEKTHIDCNGTQFSNYFWNDINSGIFYHKGKLYYIDKEGRLCTRDGIENNAHVNAANLSLKKKDEWNFVNAAKLALTDGYVVYHDDKKIYAYDYNNGKTGVLYSPDIKDDELIYGIAAKDRVLSYGTRKLSEIEENGTSEQKIYTYLLPEDPFKVPVNKVSVTGDDTLYIRMVNGSYTYDKTTFKAVISPDNATNRKILSWTSSNTGVITVDLNGVAKAVAPGEAVITVTTMDGPKAAKNIRVLYDGDITLDDGTILHYDKGTLLEKQFYSEDDRKYYLDSDGKPVVGVQNIDGNTYYFGPDGIMLTGMQTIDGVGYYFDADGIMQKERFLTYNGNQYYLDSDGKVVVGLRNINGNTYYFDKNGIMLTGTQTIDDGKYYFDSNGVMQKTSFLPENGKQYYLDADGKAVVGLQNIEGETYYFDSDGIMLTGWQTINGSKYYFDSNGIMQKNCFLNDQGKRYFLNADGVMLTGFVSINGKVYYFDTNGVMLTGWQIANNNTYYFDANGIMLTGWQTISDKKYYFDANGIMLTGWQTIDGVKNYFDEKGICLTVGWQTIDGKQYYFDMKGVPVTGWQKISGKTYYFNSEGVMQTGWKTIKKKQYYFSKKGVMQTGWKTIEKKQYYFNKKGVMQTGWKTIKKKKYYFNKKGVMQTGWKTIKGKKYYFTKKGVMVTGVKSIKGISYYFAPDGHFVS